MPSKPGIISLGANDAAYKDYMDKCVMTEFKVPCEEDGDVEVPVGERSFLSICTYSFMSSVILNIF